MEEYDIYKDIRTRTGGDIYLGVVGPVRTGKSTFITSFMNKLVVPNIASKAERERTIDELPQSANGNVIMTTQPKFVPSKAISVKLTDNFDAKVRLVDCVGYPVIGASGFEDNGNPRMVNTPWSEDAVPFVQAATLGTDKVINEHATVGVVMTTDGSIDTGIARSEYEKAEERVISALKAIKKPFVIILNSSHPKSDETVRLSKELSEKYGNSVVTLNAKDVTDDDVRIIFESMLMEFPLKSVDVEIADWMKAMSKDNEIISSLSAEILKRLESVEKMSDFSKIDLAFEDSPYFESIELTGSELGEGKLILTVNEKAGLFYDALSKECGYQIADDFQLMSILKSLVEAKKNYDKIEEAMLEAQETGYGIVKPCMEDTVIDEPQIEKRGGRYGVKLKASAVSYHVVRVDVGTEVSPLMGAEMQSEEAVKQLLGQLDSSPEGILKTNMFGKTLEEVVSDNLGSKSKAMQDETKKKMRRAIGRIVNEGKGGVICILL